MSDESNEDLEEGHEHCPVCNRINCPGAMDHCEHYFGSYWDGQVMWTAAWNTYAPLGFANLCIVATDDFDVHDGHRGL